MLSKKHRQSLRGLSHEEKIKKVQKITRVPLTNLKTNIAQSDLEEDDVSVPISLKANCTNDKQCFQKSQQQLLSKKKTYDQERINRTIREMTKQLYSLEKQKEQKRQISSKRHSKNISSFSIEDFSFDLQNNDKTQPSNTGIEDFYSIQKIEQSLYECKSSELTEISNKLNNTNNISYKNINRPIKRKQPPCYRQTEPLFFQRPPILKSYRTTKNILDPQINNACKRQSSESNLTKRFSRTKRNYETQNQQQIQKKLKFNRSNQKNKLIANIVNKQNIQNVYMPKQGMLTERLSYQQIPTYETLETALKKRKNVAKNFISYYQNLSIRNEDDHSLNQTQPLSSQKTSQKMKSKINFVVSEYEKISQNRFFKQLSSGNATIIDSTQQKGQFISHLLGQYKQSIQLLKQFL